MNRLLLDERPLFVLPSLAEAIGLNESIFLQQLHWMLGRDSAQVQDGSPTLAVKLSEWEEHFPFWSSATIRRIISDLKDAGILVVSRGRDANSFSIEPAALASRTAQYEQSQTANVSSLGAQSEQSPCKREEREKETLFDIEPMSTESKTAAPESTPDYMAEVWSHYLELFGEKLRIKELTDRRRKMIERAFKAAGGTPEAPAESVQILKDAISGLKAYRKSGQSSSTNTDLSVIFETGPHSQSNLTDQIEWWARQSESIGAGEASMPSITRAKITSRKVEVVQMLKMPNNEGAQVRGAEALAWLKENHNLTYRLADPDSPLTSRVEWIVEA